MPRPLFTLPILSCLQIRKSSDEGFNSKLDATRVKAYSKTGTSHPEGKVITWGLSAVMTCDFGIAAEAEKLIAVEVIPDTPPAKPIVSTEVVAEAPPTKVDTTALELPSWLLMIFMNVVLTL